MVEVVGGLLGLAYHRRVAAEEALLRRELPGYAAYSRADEATDPIRVVIGRRKSSRKRMVVSGGLEPSTSRM